MFVWVFANSPRKEKGLQLEVERSLQPEMKPLTKEELDEGLYRTYPSSTKAKCLEWRD